MNFLDRLQPAEAAARLDSLHRSPTPLVINLLNGAILAALFWESVPTSAVAGWYGLLCLAIVARMLGYRRYASLSRPIADSRRWFHLHAAGSIATGLLWGATSSIVLIADSPSLHMVAGLMAAGMTAGALATSFPSPYSFFGFTAACLVPMIVFFVAHGETAYYAQAVFTGMYAALLGLTARGLADAVFGSFRLEARLRDSIESLSDAFIVYDHNARVLAWNNRMVEMFPYLRDKIAAGLALGDLLVLAAEWPAHRLAPADRESWIARNLDLIGRDNGTTILDLADGRTYDARERRTAEGGWVSVFRDITEQRQAEAEMRRARAAAEEASRAKSQFLANMSHEIRTPLSGVIGVIDMMLEDGLDPDQRRKADMARRSADQLMEVIGDILDMSKLESGVIKLEAVPARLSAIVEDSVQVIAARAFAKGLEVRQDIAPAAQGWFIADPTRLRQVLINLLGNAVKFTEAGSVTVAVGPVAGDADAIEFSVRDTGIGIPAAQLPHLFKKFSQADQSISRRFGGTGLGLAIAQEFVTMMGGRIEIESEAGRGSRFHFALKLGATSAPAAHSHGRAARPEDGAAIAPTDVLRGRRILLVEDDATNRFAGGELLRRCGAEVDTAEDGEIGVAKALAGRYDLILMDMQMPRLDGLVATRRLRAAGGPNRDTPILALTANAFTDDIQQCLAAGMNAHLVKPLRRRAIEVEVPKHFVAAPAADESQCSAAALAAFESDMSKDGVLRIVGAFATTRATQMQQFRGAWLERDVAEAKRHAHSFKGVARLFGARQLENAATAFETNAEKLPLGDGAARIERIQILVDALADELDRRYRAAA